MSMDSAAAPPIESASRIRWIFRNSKGLRAGWRFLLFNVVSLVVALPFVFIMKSRSAAGDGAPFTVNLVLLAEAVYLLAGVVATAVMGRIEGRTFADYGVPWRRAFGSRFLEGAFWGAAAIGLTALVVSALGGYSVAGMNSGPDVWRAFGLWLLGSFMIGVSEEFSYRGYELWTLADGIGFWPGALLLSVYFGYVLHYLEKPNETVMDAINVTLIALFFCYAVKLTGDIWFAAGCHFTFNFISLFVLGSPNTGFGGPVEPHLLRSSFPGPDWLTGGATGLEASAVVTVVFVLLFVALRARFGRRAPESRARS